MKLAGPSYNDLYQNMQMFKPHIRYKGVWDMQDLYEFMVDYFRQRKYKFSEKVYKHKHPSPYGIERQYVWEAERVDNDIYKWIVYIYIHTYDAHDVEVKMKDGSTKVFTQGRIWMEFWGKLYLFETDDRWAQNKFWMSLRVFLNNFIVKHPHYDLWDQLMYSEIQKLVWLTRRRLKMEYDEYEQKDWMGVHRGM